MLLLIVFLPFLLHLRLSNLVVLHIRISISQCVVATCNKVYIFQRPKQGYRRLASRDHVATIQSNRKRVLRIEHNSRESETRDANATVFVLEGVRPEIDRKAAEAAKNHKLVLRISDHWLISRLRNEMTFWKIRNDFQTLSVLSQILLASKLIDLQRYTISCLTGWFCFRRQVDRAV